MPKWPAWAMAGICAACAYPAISNPPPQDPGLEHYEAHGNEPGWALLIDRHEMLYTGDHGATRITAARPDPRPSFNGRRYVAPRLTIDVTYAQCNDDISGRGYEHQVLITADGKTFSGCGGARRSDWDV